MKVITLILSVVLFSVLGSIITFFLFEKVTVLQVQRIPMDVNVINERRIGVNVDPGFHFGSIRPGSSGGRILMITDVEEDAVVVIRRTGNISAWVSHPNYFVIKKGEERNISVTVSIPKDASLGYYAGEAIITLRKP